MKNFVDDVGNLAYPYEIFPQCWQRWVMPTIINSRFYQIYIDFKKTVFHIPGIFHYPGNDSKCCQYRFARHVVTAVKTVTPPNRGDYGSTCCDDPGWDQAGELNGDSNIGSGQPYARDLDNHFVTSVCSSKETKLTELMQNDYKAKRSTNTGKESVAAEAVGTTTIIVFHGC
jgi:hypothetical protein